MTVSEEEFKTLDEAARILTDNDHWSIARNIGYAKEVIERRNSVEYQMGRALLERSLPMEARHGDEFVESLGKAAFEIIKDVHHQKTEFKGLEHAPHDKELVDNAGFIWKWSEARLCWLFRRHDGIFSNSGYSTPGDYETARSFGPFKIKEDND